ncbi:tsukushi [Spea bombifrons]|uniref:tsukushi n=1 Tax=Spea bombifrons TaxID=233779 RepID=UPI00234AF8B7|nr:tsukushi [Spea bombifrons]
MGVFRWFYVLLVTALAGAAKPCFPGCRCEVETFGLFDSFSLTKVDCSGVGSHVVPVSIPLDTSYLDLSSNSLERVNESVLSGPGYTTLVHLNLSYNRIVQISAATFSKLRYLESLDLSNNRLEALPPRSFYYSRLVDLDLSANHLSEVRTSAFLSRTQGKTLNIDLSRNNIVSVTRDRDAPPPNIWSLNLSENRLSSVPDLQGIPLRNLNLDQNPISAIDARSFLGVESLTHLSLGSLPPLRGIAPRSFKELPLLQVLDLSNNRNLQSLSTEVFMGLDSLQELNLLYSGVAFLPKDTLKHLPSMKSITWGQNIHCMKTVKERQFHVKNGLIRKEILICRDNKGALSAQDVL